MQRGAKEPFHGRLQMPALKKHQRPRAIAGNFHRPFAHRVRSGDALPGGKRERLERPGEPAPGDPRRRQRIEGKARAFRQIEAQRGGQEEDHILLADQDAAARGMGEQAVECGKLVIDPRAREAEAEHQRRANRAQGLVEIGRFLLADAVAALRRDGGQNPRINRIHVADHRHGPVPHSGGQIGAAVRRDEGGRMPERLLQIPRIDLSPTKEGYCTGGSDNIWCHERFMAARARRHNPRHNIVMK